MKEQEILKLILQDLKVGWWQIDVASGELTLSDVARQFIGLFDTKLSVDTLQAMISPLYRGYAFGGVERGAATYPSELTYPVVVNGQELWFCVKLIHDEINDQGARIVTGTVCQTDSPNTKYDATGDKERISDLVYRLNTISHMLLSLQHTDMVNETVGKILQDILSLFHGDRAYIVEFDWARRMHVSRFEVTASGVTSEGDFVSQFGIDSLPWWTEAVSAGTPIILKSLDDLPAEAFRERHVLEVQNIKSLLVMPLTSHDKVWGYAGIDILGAEREWSEVDCNWFSSIINIINLCFSLGRSEQTAKKEHHYLEGLHQHMPLGYVRMRMLFDEQGSVCDYLVVDANLAADKIFGIPRDAYVGRKGSDIGCDLSVELPLFMQVLQSGVYREYDAQLIPHRYFHSILYSMRENEIVGLISDTTEVHHAHDSLYRNEELLRNIFDNIQIGVEIYDKDGTLIDINNKDMEIFGVAHKDDVLGINFFENPNVPMEIREAVRQRQTQSFRLDYPFEKIGNYYDSIKSGFLEIYSTVNMLYDIDGNWVNFMLINIDNTEIKRAHSRLAEFESSFSLVCQYGKVGYCRFDLLSKEGYGAPQWFHNLGESEDTPLNQVIGIYSQVDPADRYTILECIRRVKLNEIDSFNLDIRIFPGRADEKWTRINVIRNTLNNDPSKIEVVCVNYDITELKVGERNLIEAKNKAEVSDRLKSAFLANMSHEIRTPLNAIVGFSALLSETEDVEERREFLHVVEENNELLLKLISDILDLSKIEAGTFEFDYEMVDVNMMCDEAVKSLSLKIADRPIDLHCGEHAEECHIYGDKTRLMQVITNFINNALKFTSEGYVSLDYVIENDFIRFEVEDTGSGISAEQQATVFDRFVKLNSFVQGTGLGLSICKSIVEQMGGYIGVDSEQGRGSRFWFAVPVGDTHLVETHEERAQRSIGDLLGRRPRVLVAEDTESNYLLIFLMLKREFDVVRVHDGAEAVRLFGDLRPDVVLMDIRMPSMDGLEAVSQIRQYNQQVPIIAITAFVSDQDRKRAMDVGCDDYFPKPLRGDQLRQRLRELLLRAE